MHAVPGSQGEPAEAARAVALDPRAGIGIGDAAAADLVIGKSSRNPAAVVRGVAWTPATTGVTPLIRPPQEDLFR